MTAPVLLPGSVSIPHQRSVSFVGNVPAETASAQPATPPVRSTRAAAYQRVLHQLMRREWHVLAEISSWARADDCDRARALAQHAELLGRVLLHHHAVERDRIWPALRRAAGEDPALLEAIEDWTGRCAAIDHRLRDVATAARQWTVTGTARAQQVFAAASLDLAEALDRQTMAEEASLLPLLAQHLSAAEWRAITRAARCPLSVAEQQLVLGLALEDAPATERAGVLRALPVPARVLWRAAGRGRYRAAVVRLRGAPPAA